MPLARSQFGAASGWRNYWPIEAPNEHRRPGARASGPSRLCAPRRASRFINLLMKRRLILRGHDIRSSARSLARLGALIEPPSAFWLRAGQPEGRPLRRPVGRAKWTRPNSSWRRRPVGAQSGRRAIGADVCRVRRPIVFRRRHGGRSGLRPSQPGLSPADWINSFEQVAAAVCRPLCYSRGLKCRRTGLSRGGGAERASERTDGRASPLAGPGRPAGRRLLSSSPERRAAR